MYKYIRVLYCRIDVYENVKHFMQHMTRINLKIKGQRHTISTSKCHLLAVDLNNRIHTTFII